MVESEGCDVRHRRNGQDDPICGEIWEALLHHNIAQHSLILYPKAT